MVLIYHKTVKKKGKTMKLEHKITCILFALWLVLAAGNVIYYIVK